MILPFVLFPQGLNELALSEFLMWRNLDERREKSPQQAWGGILALADLGGHGLFKPQATTACLKNGQKMSLVFRVTAWR